VEVVVYQFYLSVGVGREPPVYRVVEEIVDPTCLQTDPLVDEDDVRSEDVLCVVVRSVVVVSVDEPAVGFH
jgi:hypothetical protein